MHTKLIVTPVVERKDKGIVARINGTLCLFDRNCTPPAPDVPVEVMITGILYNNLPGSQILDTSKPKLLFLRVVTDEYVLVEHSGFECASDRCCTSAVARLPDGSFRTLTPGRVGVVAVDNVNTSIAYLEPIPGAAYIKRSYLSNKKEPARIEGVNDIDQLQFRYDTSGVLKPMRK
jgi:hypothetical protein